MNLLPRRPTSFRISSRSSLFVLVVLAVICCVLSFSAHVHAQSSDSSDSSSNTGEIDALKESLDEAKRLLDADKASHDETAEKKRLIDEKLAARQEREAAILEELKGLCEEQEKLSPGSLDACLAKLNN